MLKKCVQEGLKNLRWLNILINEKFFDIIVIIC